MPMCLSTIYSQVTHILRYALFFSKKETDNELIIVENSLSMPPTKVNLVVKRYIVIRNISEGEFWDTDLRSDSTNL